jgi:ketosteroid isomerase-like protein
MKVDNKEFVPKKSRQSKASRFQELLCTMEIGTAVKFDHTEFYCTGQGERCTLSHYTSLLKRKAKGEWKVKHTAIGMANVLRIS